MVALQDFLGMGIMIVVLCVIVAGAAKLFQIANDVREGKEILRDIRRSVGTPVTPPIAPGPSFVGSTYQAPVAPAPMTPTAVPTPEELVRAIHSQSFKGDDFPV